MFSCGPGGRPPLIEHPTGAAEGVLDLAPDGSLPRSRHRTARKLFDGHAFPARQPKSRFGNGKIPCR